MNELPANAGGESASGDGVRAQRIRFLLEIPTRGETVRKFVHPTRRLAVAEALAADDLLALPTTAQAAEDELRLLLLPAGLASGVDWQNRAEEWMRRGAPAGGQPTIDLTLRSERILWRPGQAVAIGSPERLAEIMTGLIEFAFYEGELRKLESELEADWQTAEADTRLTHSVDPAALAQQSHVDVLTQRTALRRIRLARLGPCLERPSIALAGPARRLASELATQAEVVDRLGWVDDRLEVFEDLYELANDRLTEFRYFLREYRLELWIIVLLVAEVVVMGAELWAIYNGR